MYMNEKRNYCDEKGVGRAGEVKEVDEDTE